MVDGFEEIVGEEDGIQRIHLVALLFLWHSSGLLDYPQDSGLPFF